jgi:uncharacterized protein
MKFQPDTFAGTNAISRHEPGAVWVNSQRFEGSLVVPWKGQVRAWSAEHCDALTAMHFDELLMLKPELVIFGSGARLRFVSAALYRSLIEARIGLETMDTTAACRTYNVLAAEGRSVVAAMLPALAN